MRIGTFSEALRSLKERYRQNLKNRAVVIALWCSLAVMLGIFCSYLVIWVSIRFTVGQIEAHPHQPVSIDWYPNVWWIGYWLFAVGLPILTLILGIIGILPGTRRKSRHEHVA
jgi:H+/Cl- antiporter ClcA